MYELYRLIIWVNIIIVAVFVSLVFSQANKKFVLDEIDFPAVAKTISQNGTPYEYRGETDRQALGLWHPPLYEYSLGAFVKVFGSTENTVRAFGMCCTLLSSLLCLLLYRDLFQVKGQVTGHVSTVFLSLFLLHPYTIANTTLPDIDSTVLPVMLLVFFYGLVRILGMSGESSQPMWSVKNTLFMSVLFALNLWAKLTTPLILIPALLAIVFVKGLTLRKSAEIAVCVAAIGGVLFLVTYWLYCYLLTLPFDFTFRFLVSSFTKNSSSGGGILALLAGISSHMLYAKQFVNWLGLSFVFAFTLAFTSLFFKSLKSESDTILFMLASVGLFVTVFYLGLTGAFGSFFKYPYPTFPILVLVVAHYIKAHLFTNQSGTEWIKVSWRKKAIAVGHRKIRSFLFAVVALAVCYYQLIVEKDIVIFEGHPVEFSYIFSLMGIAVVIGILTTKMSKTLMLSYGVAILFAVMVATQFGISRSQAVAIYPTKYHYGQIGFDETASYLKERLAPDEPIWSMKDIGHYANGKYIENYGEIFKKETEITLNIQDVIKNRGVRYFVVTTGIGQDRVDVYPALKSALDICCDNVQEFGNFVIYKAKQYE